MDFSKLKGKIYFDREYIDNKKAKIHVLNHSLHFASSVFEGIGVYNQKPLFLGEHISRLFKSAEQNTNVYGVEFMGVILPEHGIHEILTDLETVRKDNRAAKVNSAVVEKEMYKE